MTIEEKLKNYIISKYKTLKEFSKASNIPVSTLSTILNKDITKANMNTIIAICDTLNISADELSLGKIVQRKDISWDSLSSQEYELLDKFNSLNNFDRSTVMALINRLIQADKNRLITIMPMITESPIRTVELDYYDQAAGMGTGRVVENAIPEKITMPVFNVPENTDFIIRVSGDSMEPTFSSGDQLFIEAKNDLSVGEIGVFNYQGEQLVKELGEGELISHNKKYSPIKIEEDCYIQGKVLGKV